MRAANGLHPLVARQDAGKPQCGSEGDLTGYNQGLHIFALFLIMTCGTSACTFPVLVKSFPRLAVSKHALYISRHFGTGVLIALAFAHLLPTAFENLWNPCLPYFWIEGYDAIPGVIAMIAALAVMLVEMGFTMNGYRHVHSPEGAGDGELGFGGEGGTANGTKDRTRAPTTQLRREAEDGLCEGELICPCEDTAKTGGQAARPAPRGSSSSDRGLGGQEEQLSTKQSEQRALLQCLLLEAGILFHSVFIGLSISLSTGTTFIALMVAISFHQIFEGLALGARIAAVRSFRITSPKPWIMSIAVSIYRSFKADGTATLTTSQYGLTCPLGQAIGLGMRSSYDPEGQTALLVVGIANAISAGMIMYAGLVQLLGEDLISEKSFTLLSLRSRIEAVVALCFGAGLMAMIAVWA